MLHEPHPRLCGAYPTFPESHLRLCKVRLGLCEVDLTSCEPRLRFREVHLSLYQSPRKSHESRVRSCDLHIKFDKWWARLRKRLSPRANSLTNRPTG